MDYIFSVKMLWSLSGFFFLDILSITSGIHSTFRIPLSEEWLGETQSIPKALWEEWTDVSQCLYYSRQQTKIWV